MTSDYYAFFRVSSDLVIQEGLSDIFYLGILLLHRLHNYSSADVLLALIF